ncbi:membrane protein insertase YidC [Modestobacter sp. VKM Ac-2986]|uniref:membrane protein insertase YidC n=1 Tax=Modestobacter sp. VKM Ac-2986 TaxID=3004140 RepID=UPI0022AB2D70|nr:membrane protein insertase YidC [Modestobacter sp. VKM Ac-2986]MCZ2827388.1 membrane protein insertase YidC [Modestobacter sp. VKM Ac-2986]
MLDWMYTAIAWVMKTWHSAFSTFLDPASGWTWALSIVFLVITIRVLLFRLFVKQVKSQRAMQEIQPEMAKLRKQYGSDRQGLSQAMMALQKERGVNPLAGCLPLLPQIPVFIALFHVLRRLAPGKDGLYSWDDELTDQAASAKLLGAPISASFNMDGAKEQAILGLTGGSYSNIRIVALVLIVVMCFTTFFTQKQIQKRSGPVEGQAAMVQKLLLYGMPISLFVSGFFFPIGVLLYWFTNNLWTLGQQFYILKALPMPGSPDALAKAAAEKPAIDPKTLAPKPGAKPVRPKAGKPATVAPASTVDANGSVVDPSPVEGDVVPPAADAVGTGSSATGATAAGSANGRPSGSANRPRSGSSGSRSAAGPANRGKRSKRR